MPPIAISPVEAFAVAYYYNFVRLIALSLEEDQGGSTEKPIFRLHIIIPDTLDPSAQAQFAERIKTLSLTEVQLSFEDRTRAVVRSSRASVLVDVPSILDAIPTLELDREDEAGSLATFRKHLEELIAGDPLTAVQCAVESWDWWENVSS